MFRTRHVINPRRLRIEPVPAEHKLGRAEGLIKKATRSPQPVLRTFFDAFSFSADSPTLQNVRNRASGPVSPNNGAKTRCNLCAKFRLQVNARQFDGGVCPQK